MATFHLLDYGVGNVGSLLQLFEALGHSVVRTTRAHQIADTPLLILPGVGSAVTALGKLHQLGLSDVLRARHEMERPMLGICLGAQLPFSILSEAHNDAGLALLPGRVAPLGGNPGFHTGWSPLDHGQLRACGLARSLRSNETFFFNHQYVCPEEGLERSVIAFSNSEKRVTAMYICGHLTGIQFHPEKSQRQGRILMRNILEDHYGL